MHVLGVSSSGSSSEQADVKSKMENRAMIAWRGTRAKICDWFSDVNSAACRVLMQAIARAA
jgi:hypothetical protein